MESSKAASGVILTSVFCLRCGRYRLRGLEPSPVSPRPQVRGRCGCGVFRGEGREEDRERNINVWLPLVCPLLGTWPETQACVLTGCRAGGWHSVH